MPDPQEQLTEAANALMDMTFAALARPARDNDKEPPRDEEREESHEQH